MDKMTHHTTGEHREALGFKRAVDAAFRFLEPMGFHEVNKSLYSVQYESDRIFIDVVHDPDSYEISVEFGRIGRPDDRQDPFGMPDLVSLNDEDKAIEYRHPMASSPSSVHAAVQHLAQQLSAAPRSITRGEEAVFNSLHELRAKRRARVGRSLELAQVRRRAQEAWHQRDYAGVTELLASIKDHLTASEAEKLRYSSKRVPGS